MATLIRKMHHDTRLREMLPPAPSGLHKDAGLRALNFLRKRWQHHRAQVANVAEFVDRSLDELESQIGQFSMEGLVASHNDICNANWLFAEDGNIYIVDFESMSMDDPAFDLGALLWWYYPPESEVNSWRLPDTGMRTNSSFECGYGWHFTASVSFFQETGSSIDLIPNAMRRHWSISERSWMEGKTLKGMIYEYS